MFTRDYLANVDKLDKHCYSEHIESSMWDFDWHIYILSCLILKVRVKVMHILTVNISHTVTDRASIAIANKLKVA